MNIKYNNLDLKKVKYSVIINYKISLWIIVFILFNRSYKNLKTNKTFEYHK